jgi:hypothetical protein
MAVLLYFNFSISKFPTSPHGNKWTPYIFKAMNLKVRKYYATELNVVVTKRFEFSKRTEDIESASNLMERETS